MRRSPAESDSRVSNIAKAHEAKFSGGNAVERYVYAVNVGVVPWSDRDPGRGGPVRKLLRETYDEARDFERMFFGSRRSAPMLSARRH
jgi:hypothetical protein